VTVPTQVPEKPFRHELVPVPPVEPEPVKPPVALTPPVTPPVRELPPEKESPPEKPNPPPNDAPPSADVLPKLLVGDVATWPCAAAVQLSVARPINNGATTDPFSDFLMSMAASLFQALTMTLRDSSASEPDALATPSLARRAQSKAFTLYSISVFVLVRNKLLPMPTIRLFTFRTLLAMEFETLARYFARSEIDSRTYLR
jgi:hypothetical protein